MNYYLMKLNTIEEGQKVIELLGPYPDEEAQKKAARDIMESGGEVYWLDCAVEPTIGRVTPRRRTQYKCSTCERSDVRLYREYGMFQREAMIYCNAHLPLENVKVRTSWLVPLVPSDDGGAYNHTSVPVEACERWYALPEASNAAPTRGRDGEWTSPPQQIEDDRESAATACPVATQQ